MIKNNKTPLIIKHNRNYHQQISGKKELSISILGNKLCRSTLWMILLPDQISQFVNELFVNETFFPYTPKVGAQTIMDKKKLCNMTN